MFKLIDDGTLDTVFECTDCGRQERFSPEGDHYHQAMMSKDYFPEATHEEFVEECRAFLAAEHECVK